MIGCLFAFIFKKLSFDEELPEVELAKNENWVKSNLPLQSERQTAVKVMMPLTKSFIRKANKKKLKEARMTNIFIEIVVYFFYIFLGLLIAYGHRSPNAYLVSRNIENMIIRGKFDKVPCFVNISCFPIALSTSYSKFPEELLLFKKVANLNFNHAHIY